MLESGGQDAGELAGCAQFALCCGLLEELVGLVTSGFRVSQESGEGGPAGVGEYPVGLVRDGAVPGCTRAR